jgi:hypothetical protein
VLFRWLSIFVTQRTRISEFEEFQLELEVGTIPVRISMVNASEVRSRREDGVMFRTEEYRIICTWFVNSARRSSLGI